MYIHTYLYLYMHMYIYINICGEAHTLHAHMRTCVYIFREGYMCTFPIFGLACSCAAIPSRIDLRCIQASSFSVLGDATSDAEGLLLSSAQIQAVLARYRCGARYSIMTIWETDFINKIPCMRTATRDPLTCATPTPPRQLIRPAMPHRSGVAEVRLLAGRSTRGLCAYW